jgi:hypothetical protein
MVGTTPVALWAEVTGEGFAIGAAAAVQSHAMHAGEPPQAFLQGVYENAARGPAVAGPLPVRYAIRDSNPEPADSEDWAADLRRNVTVLAEYRERRAS